MLEWSQSGACDALCAREGVRVLAGDGSSLLLVSGC